MNDITTLIRTDSTLLKYILILALITWTLKQIVELLESSEKVSLFINKSFKFMIRSKTRHYDLSDNSLKEKTSELVGEINSFVADQNMSEPEFSFDDFETSSRISRTHQRKITGLYQQRFAQRVGFLHQEYVKRGFESKIITERYLNPSTAYCINEIIDELIKLYSRVK